METIRNTIAENFGGPATQLGTSQFRLEDVPDLSGKVAVVTGGNEGIGYGCTHTLLSKNIDKLVIIAKSQDTFDEAREAIAKELGQDKAKRVEFISWDMQNLKGAEKAADQVKDMTSRIDVLILNAGKGIMTAGITSDGLDEHMAQNHYAHVLLASYLLPTIKDSAKDSQARIVFLSSNAHQNAPSDTRFASLDEINTDKGALAQYGTSKLANLIYARYLGEHLTASHPNILVNAVHPGFVSTKQSTELIHEAFPLLGYGMSVGMEPFKKSQFEGALSALFAATVHDKTGDYICSPNIVEQGSDISRDPRARENLIRLTTEGLKKAGVDVPAYY